LERAQKQSMTAWMVLLMPFVVYAKNYRLIEAKEKEARQQTNIHEKNNQSQSRQIMVVLLLLNQQNKSFQ
jgi:hypothetical protein